MSVLKTSIERALAGQTFRRRRARPSAYTLMELLVVIGIIGILAALTLTIIPAVAEKRARSVARAQLHLLQIAINDYKTDLNEYPPDNAGDPSRPPLFYELTGVSFDKASGRYTSAMSGQAGFAASPPFPQKGFRNCAADGSAGKNYLAEMRSSQYGKETTGAYSGYWFLVASSRGPSGDFNTWNYVSTNPTNNPNSYDLWVNVVPRNKIIRIDNWSN